MSRRDGEAVGDIAIIGMSGRFPGARDLGELWRNLAAGVVSIGEVPPARWDANAIYSPDHKLRGKSMSKWGGFLQDADLFDPRFFRVTPRDAVFMDPQQRVFLEESWKTFEDAGYADRELDGTRVGVFVGCKMADYLMRVQRLGAEVEGHVFSANDVSMMPARISYFLNLRGPSFPVNTACSSSLVALHLACESLASGTSEMALVAGVEMMTSPGIYLALTSAGALSPGGECRAFDEGANGVVLGEGVCAVLLKSLAAALRDGDPIRGVIKGSGINQDGRSSGINAPNGAAQAALVSEIYRRAQIHPETIGYVEAHGTGTPVGDPIELHALTSAFRQFTAKRRFCPIASIKANIGHPLSAAGLAGVIKVLLCFEHGQLPPAASFTRESSRIEFEESPFFVNASLRPFTGDGAPRRAAVSSFGFSGTNAHVVLEEPPARPRLPARAATPAQLILISAKTDEALQRRVDALRAWLGGEGAGAPLADVGLTLHRGRSHFPRRLALVVDSVGELARRLGESLAPRVAPSLNTQARELLRAAEERLVRALGTAAARRGALTGLAELYLRGWLPDWRAVHDAEARRIAMPVYPFARERYWLPPAPMAAEPAPAPALASASASTSASAPPTIAAAPVASMSTAAPAVLAAAHDGGELRLGRALWQAAPPAPSVHPAGTLLVLARDEELASELAALTGRHVVLVEPGMAYAEVEPDRFVVGASGDDLPAVLAALREDGHTLGGVIVDWAPGADAALAARVAASPVALFALAGALAGAPPRQPLPIVVHAPCAGEVIDPFAQALTGLGGTLAAEAPSLQLRTVALERALPLAERARRLAGELSLAEAGGAAIRYDGERRLRRQIVLEPAGAEPRGAAPLRRGGVYLVTGGAGGIGARIAAHLACAYGARLILAGRSPESAATTALVERLRAAGGDAVYLAADLADRAQVERLLAAARARFGAVHGVFHCAGVHRDALVRNKQRAELAAVLDGKLHGTLHLDAATAGDPLEVFVLFSSLAALKGNPGQADYAYANAFLDAFAVERAARADRRGRTLSIDWPYWREGGMRLADADVDAIRRYAGLLPMASADGLRALEAALADGPAQRVVLYGERGRLDALFAAATQAPERRPPAPAAVAGAAPLADTEKLLLQIMADATQLGAGEIDPAVSFGEYGIDSVTIKSFNLRLDEVFGTLPRTLLFEHDNLRSLAGYLAREHGEAVRRALAGPAAVGAELAVAAPAAAASIAVAAAAPAAPAAAAPVVAAASPAAASVVASAGAAAATGDIAIIGVHGRYPDADDLDTFWRNLAGGHDAVREVPLERFGAELRFDPDPERAREGTVYCKWGGFVDGVDRFDARFFSIAPREAEIMDPQERLFLETAWATFEDAGYTRERMRALGDGRGAPVGVFVGVTTNTYALHGPDLWRAGQSTMPLSAPWSIANRVSYLFDLAGPSLPVDTACSSSLVALQLAVHSLRRGECQMALCGGVNLYLHSSKYIGMCQVRMLSPTGRCHSFGAAADGFVPGEGVGAVLLKPLARALADGDHVYGVIKGVAVNHGGKTNSYSVPSPLAQAELVAAALRDGQVDPATISYVEAHGTGTALGDPIEVRGLSKAFGPAAARGSCALGSVKSNIGHLEAAAGIAGLTKILLQLRERQIAPSLHAAELNPDLQLDATPFRVARKLDEWRPAAGAPRRAALSSFGAGGTNAHAVIEEAPAVARPAARGARPALVVLSAKTEPALRRYAESLLAFARRHGDRLDIDRLAYTLQVGREAMAHRLALVAGDLATLIRGLESYLGGRAQPDLWIAGEAAKGAALSALFDGDDGREFVRAALHNRRIPTLARLWGEGASFDWAALWDGTPPARIPLPTYPFERKRFWFPRPDQPPPAGGPLPPASGPAEPTRALVERAPGSDGTAGFRATLRGDEFFLRDHIIDGKPTLPGVSLLELARAAGELALGAPVTRLKQVVWVKPVVVDAPPRVLDISIDREGNGARFAIRSSGGELHAQGRLEAETRAPAAHLDADARARCNRVLGGAGGLYPEAGAATAAVQLGPSLRSIVAMRTGGGEALAELERPAAIAREAAGLVLDPAILDGALQSAVALASGGQAGTGRLFFPFSIDALEIFGALPGEALAHVRQRATGERGILKVDIDLADASGALRARLGGVAFRVIDRQALEDKRSGAAPLLFAPEWLPAPLPRGAASPDGPLLVLDRDAQLADALRAGGEVTLVRPASVGSPVGDGWQVPPGDDTAVRRMIDELAARGRLPSTVVCAWGDPRGELDEAELSAGLEASVHTAAALGRALSAHAGRRTRLLFVQRAADGAPRPFGEALAGWAASAALEGRALEACALAVDGDRTPAGLAELVRVEAAAPLVPGGAAIRWVGDQRQVRRLRAVEAPPPAGAPLPERGVVIVAGGTGTLGRLVAKHLVRRCRARIVLLGRSPAGARSQAALDEFAALGGEAIYVPADLTRADAVHAAVAEARARFGAVDAVVHAAGLLTEGYVAQRQRAAIAEVVAPKVLGVAHLDAATRTDRLAFFACFSSTAAELGNPAQADYAFANGFIDSFAAWREARRARGERSGRSLSINWSLWDAPGGIGAVDASVVAWLRQTMGMERLTPEVGLAAFDAALAGGWSRLAVFAGDHARIGLSLGERAGARVARPEPAAANPAGDDGAARAAALALELRAQAAALLKLDPAEIDLETELSDFGFESVGLIELTNSINKRYGVELMPTTFFEQRTVGALARHLVASFPEAFAGAGADRAATIDARPVEAVSAHQPQLRAGGPAPVAIVGISGAMPGSADLRAFWQNLRDGRELIGEAPAWRWRWQDHGEAARWGGFLPEVDKFDPLFFGISPREAALMDPQHRMFIEHTWKAIEDAGHAVQDFAGTRTAVFVGVATSDYGQIVRERLTQMEPHAPIGNANCMLPNRVSYLLDLHGPSEPVDTGCSSAAIAIDHAIRAIQAGCPAAIAGGVSLMLSPMPHLFFAKAGVLSQDHRCRAFDKHATGTVRGEGVGAILLKPLSQALADGNPIYAVVRGSGEGHGGRSHSLTAPNPRAQADLIAEVHRAAGVDPTRIDYVEAHGTGTALGDPVEVQGLKRAFAELHRDWGVSGVTPHIGLGSVKTNVGHLEPAAGLAAVFKVLLAMKHGWLPANLHFEQLNPFIDLKGTPFYVVDLPRRWEAPTGADGRARPRLAAVSSFGMGGANAHLVLEELPRERAAVASGAPQLVVLSAKSEERLRAYAEALAAAVGESEDEEATLDEIAFTLQRGRDAMPWRFAAVVGNKQQLFKRLRQFLRDEGRDVDWFVGVAEGAAPAAADDSLEALARAWVCGAKVDFVRLHARPQRRVPLPTYPFARQRYWLDQNGATETSAPAPLDGGAGAGRPRGVSDADARGAKVGRSERGAKVGRSERGADGGDGERGAHDERGASDGNGERGAHDERGAGDGSGDQPPVGVEDLPGLLRRLAAAQLELDPTLLRDDEPLASFGMDSINLATFLARVGEALGGRSIDLGGFAGQPTLRGLTAFLGERLRLADQAAGPRPARARDEAPRELVAFHPSGCRAPSFWLPGSFGFTESFRSLALALGPDHPLYSFRARGNDGARLPFTRVEEMAAAYVDELTRVRPRGPYLLGGYSFGGLVALEMAQILARRGERVGKLVLLDAYPPTREIYDILRDPAGLVDIKIILANFLTGHGEWSQLITRADLDGVPPRMHLAELAKRVAERGRTGMSADQIFGLMRGASEVSEYAAEMTHTYRPAPYDASDVLFFRSRPGADAYMGDYDYVAPWRQLVRGRLIVHECPGNHSQMTGEAALAEILAPLRAALAELEEAQSNPRPAIEAVLQ